MGNSFHTSKAHHGAAVKKTVRDDKGGPHRIALVPEDRLRQLAGTRPEVGTPRYAATRSKNVSGKPKWELLLYPTPNDAITIEYQRSINPEPLSNANQYPLGGPQMAELLLQSCMAVAEEMENKEAGIATARFQERLAAAIQLDVQSLAATEENIWPVDDEPSDLQVDKAYLQRLIGRKLKYGTHPNAWTHKQANEVDEAVRTGLRRFYTPPPLPGEKYAHEWSFLKPMETIQVREDVLAYELPEDFAYFEGDLTYDPGTAALYPPLREVSEAQIRERRQNTDYSARPEVFAKRVKQQVDGDQTRWEILVWPVPDGAYSINYRYRSNPGLLSSGIAKPAGGMPHAQTVVEACLAAVEAMQGETKGPHEKLFWECLLASVSHDRIAGAPTTLGYNSDNSDSYTTEYSPEFRRNFTHVTSYSGYNH